MILRISGDKIHNGQEWLPPNTFLEINEKGVITKIDQIGSVLGSSAVITTSSANSEAIFPIIGLLETITEPAKAKPSTTAPDLDELDI